MAGETLFFINALSLLAAIALLIYLAVFKQYESEEYSRSITAFLFSIFILVLGLAVNVVVGLRESFRLLVLPVEAMPAVEQIGLLGLMPLFAICLLVTALIFKEDLK